MCITWRLFILLAVFILSFEAKIFRSILQDSEWEDVVAAGGMDIGHGRSKRFVELDENQPNKAYQACILPNGKTGNCRHLRYCIQDDFMTNFTRFMDYLCIIKHSAIGVCCPGHISDDNMAALAGDLPATAPIEESVIAYKIDRAENRGCGLSTRAQGRSQSDFKVTKPRDWPWIAVVALKHKKQHCGGSLITEKHVLTAAHCTYRWRLDLLIVRLGEYDIRRTNDSLSYTFRVIEKHDHALFDRYNYQNDIAILKLHKAAVFNTYVWPICLPPRKLPMDDEIVTVIGWGRLWYGGPYSEVLMEVSVPIWEQKQCTDAIFNDTVCAGGKQGGRDSCQGDSGGPLMYQMPSGRWAVVGVVSWGIRCGEADHPGVYTKVDTYLEWIQKNTVF